MEQNHKSVQGETEQKIYSYIGLATKAGKAVSGEFSTEKAIKERKAKLVLISKEASDNTKKKFIDSCSWYKVPIYLFGDKERLGHSMGKQLRASLAIMDEGLANAIVKQFTLLKHEDQRRQE